ncbi:malto-oligosyltrehalose trehalohydrolase [soil metagenome]
MHAHWRLHIGAEPGGDATRFRVWAPSARTVDVILYGESERAVALQPSGDGYFEAQVSGAAAGDRYRYRLDGGDSFPDPASRFQPEGVHGPSEIVDPAVYNWSDGDWTGLDPDALVIYELHVGTFTPEGTFRSAIGKLDHLAELGVTAVEVMPIANFPGDRNWGYDGVQLFAPATAYGTPDDFKAFVDAAHGRGLGVILDVVYNHLGPEGNYIPAITGGRFFTDRHKTPWGDAVNFDGPNSGPVRDFVLHNALYWAHEYHVDGLRLDATHAIVDDSEVHILEEIARAMHALSPGRVVIAEDERNERRLVMRESEGGFGLDAVWADDLHHQLRRLTAGDSEGYFADYAGTLDAVAETLRKGWFDEGQLTPGRERRGTPAAGLRPAAFVHCIQNHDQVGNRALGERLNHEIPPPIYRALSALLLVSPYTPLLWMGQEWAATSPFQYFTDHPEELGRLVTEGRREEFKRFSAFQDPEGRKLIPDPQAVETFERSRLVWAEHEDPVHSGVLRLYRELLRLRATVPALRSCTRDSFRVGTIGDEGLWLLRSGGGDDWLFVAALSGGMRADLEAAEETRSAVGAAWHPSLWSEDRRFGGGGDVGEMRADGELLLGSAGAVLLRAGAVAD